MFNFGANWRYWLIGIAWMRGFKMFWINLGPFYMEVWYGKFNKNNAYD